MRASARAVLLVGGAAGLLIGVAPAVATPQSGPVTSEARVAEGRGDDDGRIKACPKAGVDGMGQAPWTSMGSMHRAHHGDRAADADAAAGVTGMVRMHRAHHGEGDPGDMRGGRHGDMMSGVDGDDMMGSGHMGR